MLDAKILENEWVEPNTDGDGWGHRLKDGAPPEVVKEFEEFQKALDTHRN